MKKIAIYIAGWCLFLLTICLCPARAEEVNLQTRVIGFVEALDGTASALSYAGIVRQLAANDPVFLRDVLRTGPETRLQVRFDDQSVFVVTANSEVRADEFVYDPVNHAGLAKIYVKGVFRFVTGRIAKIKPENMQVEVPVGTIGVRGTRVAGRADDNQTFVMLEKPGINEEAGHWLVLANEVNGQRFESVIEKAGHGSFVKVNQAPAKETKVDRAALKALLRDLGGDDASLNINYPPDPGAPPPPKKENKVKKFFKGLGKAAQTASDVASAAS